MSEPATTVWCASFPKSGNTWLRALISGVIGDGTVRLASLVSGLPGNDQGAIFREFGLSPSVLDDRSADALMAAVGASIAQRSPGPVFRKTHNSFRHHVDGSWSAGHVLPTPCRAVYIVRDPRAVAVSLAHHMGTSQAEAVTTLARGPLITVPDAPTDRYPTRTCRVAFDWGSWSTNVESWLDQTEMPVWLLRYEDLLADPLQRLTELVAWLELDVPMTRLRQAVDEASFANLAVQELVVGFSEAAGPDRQFFRRGEADAWREELPAELGQRIVADHGRVMRRLGYPTEQDSAASIGEASIGETRLPLSD